MCAANNNAVAKAAVLLVLPLYPPWRQLSLIGKMKKANTTIPIPLFPLPTAVAAITMMTMMIISILILITMMMMTLIWVMTLIQVVAMQLY